MKGDWNDLSIRNAAAYRPAKTVDYGVAGRECQRIYLHIPVAGTQFPATVWFHGGGLTGGGREVTAPCGGSTSLISPDQLAGGAEVLAFFETPDSREKNATLVRQGRFLWYFSDQEFSAVNASDAAALDRFLGGR